MRVLSFTSRSCGLFYAHSLELFNVRTLFDRRQKLRRKLFDPVTSKSPQQLYHLLPPRHNPKYNHRYMRGSTYVNKPVQEHFNTIPFQHVLMFSVRLTFYRSLLMIF